MRRGVGWVSRCNEGVLPPFQWKTARFVFFLKEWKVLEELQFEVLEELPPTSQFLRRGFNVESRDFGGMTVAEEKGPEVSQVKVGLLVVALIHDPPGVKRIAVMGPWTKVG